MALYYELPVYKDTYKLIIKIFEYTKDFSREYKYTLGQDMKRDALQLIRSIYRANKSANKKEHLDTFIDDFEFCWFAYCRFNLRFFFCCCGSLGICRCRLFLCGNILCVDWVNIRRISRG